MTSKCGKNKKVAHEAQPSVSLMFLPHFDLLCDLLGSLKAGSHIIAAIVSIAAVNSKSGLTIGTII